MLEACCDMMRSYGRDHFKGVPESDLPDAIIEVHRDENRWMMAYRDQGFTMEIQHCPWCGAQLGPSRRVRLPLEPAADEVVVRNEKDFELWCQGEAEATLTALHYTRSHVETHRNTAGHLICRIRFAKAGGGEAIVIIDRDPSGVWRQYIQLG
jgi:hypothetical protein